MIFHHRRGDHCSGLRIMTDTFVLILLTTPCWPILTRPIGANIDVGMRCNVNRCVIDRRDIVTVTTYIVDRLRLRRLAA